MRALLIDAHTQEIREIVLDAKDTLAGMQKAVDGLICRATIIETTGDEVYVNDEGLFAENQVFFSVAGGHQPFAGNGVVVRYDENGNNIGTDLPIAELSRLITWHGDSPPIPGDEEDLPGILFL